MSTSEKIRTTAKVFWIVSIVVSIIMFIAGLIIQDNNSGYYGDDVLYALGQDLWITGLVLLPCMWLVTVLTYGFADMVRDSASQTACLEKLASGKVAFAAPAAAAAPKASAADPALAKEEDLNALLPKL